MRDYRGDPDRAQAAHGAGEAGDRPDVSTGINAVARPAPRPGARARLARAAARPDAQAGGWRLVGGTALCRARRTGDVAAAQVRLARARIRTRMFACSKNRIRPGSPGDLAGWRPEAALEGLAR